MKEKRWNGRRKFLLGSISLLVSGLFFGAKAQNEQAKKIGNGAGKNLIEAKPRLGINLAGIADWNTEQPFVDFFHMSRDWISQPVSGAWGSGPTLELDANGWVKALASGCRATRIICSLDRGQYPSGEYVVLYDGEGDFKLGTPVGKIFEKAPGRMVVQVNASKGMFALDLVSTNPKNYMRNIRVIAPGFESAHQKNPWHPAFLKRWSGIACIRFMDFMATNNSGQISWQDRPKINDAGYTTKGVPVELLVDLANRLETDAWFCMPHKADDDYVKAFASYVKENLHPTSRAWVEYSNEIWNGGFEQSKYAGEMGQSLKLADKPWEAAWKYTAYRSVEVFKIWTSVYGNEDSVVRVLPSQAANAYVSEQIVSFQNAAQYADVLAIAPYVSLNVAPKSDSGVSENIVAAWSIDQVFNHLANVSLPESSKWIADSKKIADKYGLKLVAYEGGQHMVGIGGAENNDKLNALFFAANADKRMAGIYTKNLTAWEQAGGDLMCTFTSMTTWSKWGSWGLLRNNKESAKDSPKFSAVIQWAIAHGQKMFY